MNPAMAGTLARVLSLIVFGLAAFWYVAPWLRTRGRADALIALLWVHAFRHVALHLASIPQAGSSVAISDPLLDRVIYGDVTATILAVVAIAALRVRSRLSIPLVWLFAAESVADIVNVVTTVAGGHVPAFTDGGNWLVRSFFVPLVLVSFILIVWQLITRWGEPLVHRTEREGTALVESVQEADPFGTVLVPHTLRKEL